MAAAQPGATIYLRGGTYQELATFQANRQCCVWLNKPIALVAYLTEVPIVTYGTVPSYDGTDYGPIVYATAANAIMRGLTIVGTHAAGDSPGGLDFDCNVLIADSGGVMLDRCIVQSWGHCGAKTALGALTITDCVVQDGGFTFRDHGAYISDAGAVTIRRTTFQRCASYGVHLYGTPQGVTVDGCTITDNGRVHQQDAGGGVLMDGNGGHTVNTCAITANDGYGGLVLYQSPSVGNVITSNTITGNLGRADVVLDHAVQPQTESGNTVGTYWTNTDFAAWPH